MIGREDKSNRPQSSEQVPLPGKHSGWVLRPGFRLFQLFLCKTGENRPSPTGLPGFRDMLGKEPVPAELSCHWRDGLGQAPHRPSTQPENPSGLTLGRLPAGGVWQALAGLSLPGSQPCPAPPFRKDPRQVSWASRASPAILYQNAGPKGRDHPPWPQPEPSRQRPEEGPGLPGPSLNAEKTHESQNVKAGTVTRADTMFIAMCRKSRV